MLSLPHDPPPSPHLPSLLAPMTSKQTSLYPQPFLLANPIRSQVASGWNSANPNAPIKNGDVEVMSVNASCGSRRSHRSLMQSTSIVTTSSSINLPLGACHHLSYYWTQIASVCVESLHAVDNDISKLCCDMVWYFESRAYHLYYHRCT